MPNIIQFSDFQESEDKANQHILLGNGFSRSYDEEVFAYQSIFESAGFDPLLSNIFGALHTHDFEYVSQALASASKIVNCLSQDHASAKTISNNLSELSSQVRGALATTIIDTHPMASVVVPDLRIERCIDTLAPFARVFTTNYDLLIYWMIAKYRDITSMMVHEKYRDGFGWKDQGSKLLWPSVNTSGQNVFYLHGALHLFSTGIGVEKIKYNEKTGETLLDAIRVRIEDGQLPILVTEGDVSAKVRTIRSDTYLSRCLYALQWTSGRLATYGFSFHENDTHISDAIVHSSIHELSIGFHGDEPDKTLIEKAESLVAQRENYRRNLVAMFKSRSVRKIPPALEIQFFSTRNINPWGTKAEALGFMDKSE